jgi:DNA modification methylase
MIFTDPPYNVGYIGGTKQKLTMKNDKMSSAAFATLLRDSFTAFASFVLPGTPIYVCYSDSESINFRSALINSGWLIKSCLVWVKNHFKLSRGDYHMKHEPIIYGWRAGAAHKWYGGRCETSVIMDDRCLVIDQSDDGYIISIAHNGHTYRLSVPSYELSMLPSDGDTSIWQVPKPVKSLDHPTIKPVALMERAINNSSIPGDVVADVFLGSGSTLIACEKTGRVCYGMEIDPHYCDVIVERWEDFTGLKATVEHSA